MRYKSLLFAFAITPFSAYGQKLSLADSQIAESARAKYYNLEAQGFQSLECFVKFDISTVPLLSQNVDDPIRKLIEAITFTLAIDSKGRPNIQYLYPSGTDDNAKKEAAQVTNLLRSLVGGLFQTWPSKGLNGPIPPFDNQIESIVSTNDGYTFNLRVPGAPVHVFVDRNYLAKEIVSAGGKLHEQPRYVPTPQGFVFSGNEAVDETHPGSTATVKYELQTSLIENLRVPTSAHLQVNDNINVKFAMADCSVQKAKVVRMAPSVANGKP